MKEAEGFIDGVSLVELKQISDSRGSVLHMLRCDSEGFVRFGECYFSEVLPGAVKAWKKHAAQTQNLAVPVGRILIVIYDDRSNSPTYRRFQSVELGRPDAYRRLHIPPGLWYGFTCLSPQPALLANCPNAPHDPKESEQIPFNDPKIPYEWELIGSAYG